MHVSVKKSVIKHRNPGVLLIVIFAVNIDLHRFSCAQTMDWLGQKKAKKQLTDFFCCKKAGQALARDTVTGVAADVLQDVGPNEAIDMIGITFQHPRDLRGLVGELSFGQDFGQECVQIEGGVRCCCNAMTDEVATRR